MPPGGISSHAGMPRHPFDEDHGVELHRMAIFIFIVILLHIAGVVSFDIRFCFLSFSFELVLWQGQKWS